MDLITTDSIDFYYITNNKDLICLVNLIKNIKRIALDTEVYPLRSKYGTRASSFDCFTSRIRLIQINWDGNYHPYIIDLDKVTELEDLKEQLMREDLEKIIFSSLFDLKQIKATLDIWLPNTKCAGVVMQRLALCTGFKSAQMRGNSYKALARDYLNVFIDKVEAKSDWSRKELTKEQLIYAALDVGSPKDSELYSLLLQGYDLLTNVLETPYPKGYGVKRSLDIDQQANNILAKIEYRGMPISKKLLEKLRYSNLIELEERKLKLCIDLGLPVIKKVVMSKDGPMLKVVISDDIAKTLNNPKKLVELINSTLKIKLDNVQGESLTKLLKSLEVKQEEEEEEESEDEILDEDFISSKEGIDIINNLISYKKLVKALGTDYLSIINPKTGCLHSRYKVCGASTSRMSSGGGKETFNCQQIPIKEHKINALSDDDYFSTESVVVG